MKKALFIFISLLWLAVPALAATELIPVGQVIGLELQNGSVSIAGFAGDSPAKAAGLQEGDRILTIDEKTVTSATDVREALAHSRGSVTVTVQRGGKEHAIRLSPAITADGPKLGVYLKEGVTGIGTVTYYDPETGSFAALGHGVNTPDGKLLQLTRGSAYSARVASVRKGKVGTPGQLVGAVTASKAMGSIHRNTGCGVFGKTDTGFAGKAIPLADPSAVRPGEATILSNISGTEVREYSVQICRVYPDTASGDRNMLIEITDKTLLETTGGIVQGMSGSPIIQDGKLVGAVTHVLVNDPTTGYGIFIENMLEAAG